MYVKHHTCLFCRFGVTRNVSHLWMSNLGDGIMKFCSQAEQAQLHGAHMQTFIIEQQAFIIHTGGFPCSPQINYEPALHTLTHWCWNTDGDEYLVAHHLRWQEPCLVIYSLKKSTLKRCDEMHCGLCPVQIGASGLSRSQLKRLTRVRDDFGDIDSLLLSV